MSSWRSGLRLFFHLASIYGMWLLVTLVGRVAMLGWQHARMQDLSGYMQVKALLLGWRMDTMALGYLLAIPMLLLCLAPTSLREVAKRLLLGWTLAVLLLLLFMEAATFPFFAQYDVRPNILFVEYLIYPKEVVSMLWKSQKLNLALTTFLLAGALLLSRRLGHFFCPGELLEIPWRKRAIWCLPLALLLFLGIRSSFGHRPANISDAIYSSNRVANEIAKNSLYSVADAWIRSMRTDSGLAKRYGPMERLDAYKRAFALLGTPSDPAKPFYRTVQSSLPSQRPRNLVIIIEESMGAQFTALGRKERSLTPHLDRLSQEGIAFTQLFASGTRSIRGLSAMSAGFLPIAGEGVIKRPKSQSGFFSLASLLKPHGYHSSFIYGGEARFDNMKAWYSGNGFDEIIEEKDYSNPTFSSSWGVSDEDLFMKANDRFKNLSKSEKPFVSVVFTSSNHEPFELPEGKIDWEQGVDKRSVENAIKYADYALGRFFEQARREAYYKNTVFVLVADHNVRSYGDDVVPVSSFQIPGVIVGGDIAPRRYDGLCSQQDVLATALDLLGLPLEHPVLGNSVLKPGHPAFVLMQFNDVFAFRKGEKIAVFRSNKSPETFDYIDSRLRPAASDPALEQDGLALLHVTEDLYARRLYR